MNLDPVHVEKHIGDLVTLAKANPTTASRLVRGDLTSAPLALQEYDLKVIYRQAIIWMVADLVRIARLVVAIRDASRSAMAVQDLIRGNRIGADRPMKRGALLANEACMLNALLSLECWPEVGAKGLPHRCNEFVATLQRNLELIPAVQRMQSDDTLKHIDFRKILSSYRPFLSETLSIIDEHPGSGKRRRAQGRFFRKFEEGRVSSNISTFESLYGVPELVSVLMVAIRISDMLRRISNYPSGEVWCERSELLRDCKYLNISSHLMVFVQIIRVNIMCFKDQDCSTRVFSERSVNWVDSDFSSHAVYEAARKEISVRKLMQSESRMAKAAIRRVAHVNANQSEEADRFVRLFQDHLDISHRFRTRSK
jgi:hypothetical protein